MSVSRFDNSDNVSNLFIIIRSSISDICCYYFDCLEGIKNYTPVNTGMVRRQTSFITGRESTNGVDRRSR